MGEVEPSRRRRYGVCLYGNVTLLICAIRGRLSVLLSRGRSAFKLSPEFEGRQRWAGVVLSVRGSLRRQR